MFSGAQNSVPLVRGEPKLLVSQQAPGPEALRQRIVKIHEAQKRLLSALQSNQLPLSQVATDLARLEGDLAEAQRELKQVAQTPA
jgi:hypothetical protein